MKTAIQNRLFILALLLIVVCCGLLLPLESIVAYADTTGYSTALEDLSQDSKFDIANYPTVVGNNSLDLVQIAEGTDKRLYVYLYQPSGKTKDYRASSINISTDRAVTLNSVHNYFLEYCNNSGTLYKYVVKEFTVSDDNVRYYTIPSVFRPYDKKVDGSVDGDNTVSETPFEVSRQYEFGTINGNYYMNCIDIETITVTDKFVGFVRYEGGFDLLKNQDCDSHFVAFNTDKPIDKLIEAEVEFTTQEYTWSFAPVSGASESFGSILPGKAELTADQKVDYTGAGVFAKTYTWARIQSVDAFKSSVDITEQVYSGVLLNGFAGSILTDEATAILDRMQWVLRFKETPWILSGSSLSGYTSESSTLVGDVTILRLKFETVGVTYNMGVVDNKQTGSKDPVNENKFWVEYKGDGSLCWLYKLLGIVTLILLLPVLPYVIKVIVWIVTLPFKLLDSVLKKSSKRKKE